jgi:hypothetical protein
MIDRKINIENKKNMISGEDYNMLNRKCVYFTKLVINIKNIIKNQIGRELYENVLEIIRECRNEGV